MINARLVGKYALWPDAHMLTRSPILSTVRRHRDIFSWSRDIQEGTAAHTPLHPKRPLEVSLDRDTDISFDGQPGRLEASRKCRISVSGQALFVSVLKTLDRRLLP